MSAELPNIGQCKTYFAGADTLVGGAVLLQATVLCHKSQLSLLPDQSVA